MSSDIFICSCIFHVVGSELGNKPITPSRFRQIHAFLLGNFIEYSHTFFTIIVVCGPELGNNTFSIRQIHIFHWANLLDHFFI